MELTNKYNMTKEQNIFLAKRNIVDSIWKSAKLEGISVTYPETAVLMEGGKVNGLTVDEVVTINNLKHAWNFILENEGIPNNLNTIKEINKLVGTNLIINAGDLRSVPVKIGGTDWTPQFPIESQIKENLDEILKTKNPTDRAISTMLYIMRSQMFLDGNKRTAMLFVNKIMIENGCGIIQIPVDKQKEFFDKLVSFYETGEVEELKKWIYDNCIDGIDFIEQNKIVPDELPLKETGDKTFNNNEEDDEEEENF